MDMERLITVGHGRLGADELVGLLRGAGVDRVVDVRSFPGSRANPHMARERMAEWLPAAGLGYRWERRLGGRRRLPRDQPSPDTWWTQAAFRAYAGYTRTDDFRTAMTELLAEPDGATVMCSESVWWRCHRRIIADVAVLEHNLAVTHLMHDGRLTPHPPAEGARTDPELGVVWDGGHPALW